MKNFFYVLFGGLGIIICGVVITFFGRVAVDYTTPRLAKIKLPSISIPSLSSISNLATSIISQPTDGTYVSGLKRIAYYSASEEEDLISSATMSLPTRSTKNISATAYIVEDLNNGNIISESNPDKILPIASLTKLVTAEVAKRLFKGDEKIQITKEVMATYGNTAQFRAGEVFRVEDLFYPLLMVSSNDAAEAFAQSYGREKFLLEMNNFVQSIGAYRTAFSDPSGLSPNNISTANDLVTILNWIRINDPSIIAITQMKTKTIRVHTWINPTHFLSWSTYRGGKNGYTDEANRTAATLFQAGKNKDIYSIVILGSGFRDDDIIKLMSNIKDW